MWCPAIKAIRMGGTKAERQAFIQNDYPLDPATGKRKFDVLVTSYEGLLKEKGRLGKVEWSYLVIDEAHRIKNEHSSLSNAVRTIGTHFRLLITGTPLQVSHCSVENEWTEAAGFPSAITAHSRFFFVRFFSF